MTQEEQAIEDKFNQLYERYKVWPHIPPTEQELFCKLLLDSNLVRKITLKAFSLFKETMASQANGLDPKTYKSFCASSVFDTIIKIFEKFEPTEGNFIRYFSSSYKRMLGNRIKEDFIDTGSQTTFYPLPPKRIKAIKRVLEQQEKLRGKTLTYDAKLEYLQTQFKLSPYEAEFVLTPQRCNIELISRTDLDDAYNDDDDSISPYENAPDTTSKSSEEILFRIGVLQQIFSTIQKIFSDLSTRKDTVERYSIIATWSVILWFDLKRFYTHDELIKCKIKYSFLDKQIIADYYRLGKDFYTESQQLAQAGFFPSKSKVTKYKTDFEDACRTNPILPNLIQDMIKG